MRLIALAVLLLLGSCAKYEPDVALDASKDGKVVIENGPKNIVTPKKGK